ncbi:AraC family transcriptional regulator [Flammeovirga pectinis]|uniref:AraC family transcriptional regulator n=1 Tax=Flammeovirga pectinis TaxID=2494373 RepID=A0A3S9P6D5_9BACT|nr:AraC family transcriptional regulator [Flammeovirga pectinis]AZQ63733.1 AraC family transcriptional regulator [Flammeovirga pectinis]
MNTYKMINGSGLEVINKLQSIFGGTFENDVYETDTTEVYVKYEYFSPFDSVEIMIHHVKYKQDMYMETYTPATNDKNIYFQFEYLGNNIPTTFGTDADRDNAKMMSIMSSKIPLSFIAHKGDEAKWMTVRIPYDYYHKKMSHLEEYIGKVFEKDSSWVLYDIAPMAIGINIKKLFDRDKKLSIPLLTSLFVCSAIENVAIFLDRIIKRDPSSESAINMHKDDIERIQNIKNELTNLYQKTPSLNDLADKYGVSVSKLKRDFNAVFGTSIHKFHTDYKLEMAYNMLMTKQSSITDVSRHFGYKTISRFSESFKLKYGVTPKQVASKFQ